MYTRLVLLLIGTFNNRHHGFFVLLKIALIGFARVVVNVLLGLCWGVVDGSHFPQYVSEP